MSTPSAQPTPARAPAVKTNAQADLVRRYARMLRMASASAGVRPSGTATTSGGRARGPITR
jgi:hypothetical protein